MQSKTIRKHINGKTMDYKKKYKEALEWARKVMQGKTGFVLDEVLEKFPELKESEDERIKKALINGVECCKASGWTNFGNNVDIDVVLAWLEKQGERKPVESPKDYHSIDPHFGISVEDLITKKNTNDKVEPRYNIGDVLCDKSCTTLDKNSQPNIEILDIRDDMYICNNCTFPISQQDEYELVAKRIEPQTVWSEEDEQYLLVCKNALAKYQTTDKWDACIISHWLENKLKSLKDRVGCEADCTTTKEWSEVDRIQIETIACHLDNIGNGTMAESLLNIMDKYKSHRPQNRWKPSEKQLKSIRDCALNANIGAYTRLVLDELYQDLKKLMEE